MRINDLAREFFQNVHLYTSEILELQEYVQTKNLTSFESLLVRFSNQIYLTENGFSVKFYRLSFEIRGLFRLTISVSCRGICFRYIGFPCFVLSVTHCNHVQPRE